jgi:carbonic anhydrase
MIYLTKDVHIRKNRFFPLIMLAGLLSLTLVILSACAASPVRTAEPAPPESVETPHWTYQGDTGPDYWYALDPAYAVARDGEAQSPIDIVTADLAEDRAVKMPVIMYRETPFIIENNGHTIELVPVAAGNRISVDGDIYELQQFHFHAPSEHLIDGAAFAMELHLVHADAQGNLAVIGIMIVQGARNETLGEVFENMPPRIAGEGAAEHRARINLADLFTGSEEMYRYEGSLTTPPCTEGVKWSVSARPVTLSSRQLDAFRALYQGNNRPVQNRYDRRAYAAVP